MEVDEGYTRSQNELKSGGSDGLTKLETREPRELVAQNFLMVIPSESPISRGGD